MAISSRLLILPFGVSLPASCGSKEASIVRITGTFGPAFGNCARLQLVKVAPDCLRATGCPNAGAGISHAINFTWVTQPSAFAWSS
jgi:hypothetical protein